MHIGILLVLLLVLLPATALASSEAAFCRVTIRPASKESGNIATVVTADCGKWTIKDLANLHPRLGGLKVKGPEAGSTAAKCGQQSGLNCLLTFCTDHKVKLHLDAAGLNTSAFNGIVCVTNSAAVWLMDGSNFSTNTVFGGSVLMVAGNGTLNVTNTSFTSNDVENGTIRIVDSGHLAVNGSEFQHNRAAFGGAIYVDGLANVTLDDIHMISNNASENGGGMFVGGYSMVTVHAASMYHNRADKEGGGMMVGDSATAILDDVNISNNTAVQDGGGMFVDSYSMVSVHAVNICDNRVGMFGGGMAVGGNATAILDDVNISGNTADGSGGGMMVGGNATAELDGVNISGNTAVYEGGGMMVRGYANATLDGVNISSNKAVQDGGGMFVDSYSMVSVHAVNICDNRVGMSGGGMAVGGNATAILDDVNISGNTADGSGGGMMVGGNATAELDGVNISGNTAVYEGGGMKVGGRANATLDGVNISSNTADKGGGGMMVGDAAIAKLDGVYISSNTARRDDGGGGMMVGLSSMVTVHATYIYQNGARDSGGGMAVLGDARATLDGVNISSNSAGKGGGIFVSGSAKVNVHAAVIYTNVAVFQDGGGMMVGGYANATLDGVNISSNNATSGGGLSALAFATVVMTACKVTYNVVEQGGGGIQVRHHAKLNLTSVEVLNNSARSGGGLSTSWRAAVVMTACNVTKNVVTEGGAGIQVQDYATLMLDSVELLNNSAGAEGGGILAHNRGRGPASDLPDDVSLISVQNSLIQGHRARSGAAVSNQGYRLTLGRNVTICDNHAESEGGALQLIGGVDIKANVKVFNNTAGTTGAGIYWTLSGCDVSTMLGELGRGSWLCPEHAQLNMSKQGVNITQNSAGLAGGGIFINSNIDMTRTQANKRYGASVKGNTAAYSDADIFVLTRDCGVGQSNKSNSGWCDRCPPGQYNINSTNSTCRNCDDRADCSPGGAIIVSKAGFWHTGSKDSQCKLDEIIRCPNADACAHNVSELQKVHPYSNGSAETSSSQWTSYTERQCSKGYQGVMCTVCSSGYGRTDGFTCEACLGVAENGQVNRTGVVIIIAVYFVVFTLYILLTSLLSLYNGSQNSAEALDHHSKSMPWWSCLEFNDVSKAFVTYLQYTVGIIVKLPIVWPGTLSVAFRSLTQVWGLALGSAVSLDCLMPESDAWKGVQAGVTAIISLGAPLATFIAVMTCHLLLWWLMAALPLRVRNPARVPDANSASGIAVYQPSANRECLGYLATRLWHIAHNLGFRFQSGWGGYLDAAKTFAFVAFIVSIFFWYPSITRVFVGAFVCIRGCGGHRYWVMDTRKACPWGPQGTHDSLSWALGVGVPAAAICLGTIVVVIAFLVHSQRKGFVQAPEGGCIQRPLIEQRMFRMRYGYLYSDHKHGIAGADSHVEASHGNKDHNVTEQEHTGCLACSSLLHGIGTCPDNFYVAWQGVKGYIYLCWDAVLHCQTLVLVFISVYGQLLHEYYQVLILSFTFAAYLVLLMWLQPYRRGSQELQTLSFFVMFATSFATLAFIAPQGVFDFNKGDYDPMKRGVAVVMLVVNVGLIMLMVLLLLCMLCKDFSKWRHRINENQTLAECSSIPLDGSPIGPSASL